ncbi:MAG: hypothetical protein HW391_436 [Chloroflexi bacterium]|nr:hypothetical protein [Chloroflexota bacterium]
MGPECDEEAGFAVPTEQHPQVIVHAERPVVAEVTFQLVRSEEGILRIRGEPPEGGPEQLVTRGLQLARPPEESGGRDHSHVSIPSSAAQVGQQGVHVLVRGGAARGVLGLCLPDLAQEERPTRRAKLLALRLVSLGIDEIGGRLRTLQDCDGLVCVLEPFKDLRRPLAQFGHTDTLHSTLHSIVDGPASQSSGNGGSRSVRRRPSSRQPGLTLDEHNRSHPDDRGEDGHFLRHRRRSPEERDVVAGAEGEGERSQRTYPGGQAAPADEPAQPGPDDGRTSAREAPR